MDAKELRIGNLVYYNGYIVKIDGIRPPEPNENSRYSDKWLIDCWMNTLTVPLDECSPIELNSKWLLRADFELERPEEEKEDFYWSNGTIFCLFQDYDWGKNDGSYRQNFVYPVLMRYGNPREYKSGISVKYVHKLQNLYFSLRNEELHFKNIEQ